MHQCFIRMAVPNKLHANGSVLVKFRSGVYKLERVKPSAFFIVLEYFAGKELRT